MQILLECEEQYTCITLLASEKFTRVFVTVLGLNLSPMQRLKIDYRLLCSFVQDKQGLISIFVVCCSLIKF